MIHKNTNEKEADQKVKTAAVAKADKAWADYAQLTPENRDTRKLAELWSQKEVAEVALKKSFK